MGIPASHLLFTLVHTSNRSSTWTAFTIRNAVKPVPKDVRLPSSSDAEETKETMYSEMAIAPASAPVPIPPDCRTVSAEE